MNVFDLNILVILLISILDLSSIVSAYEFQCLTCDNFIDGPGCGEFTKQIPVRNCRTFCYFAIVHNYSSNILLASSKTMKSSATSTILTRAIRDCSPFDDMSIEENLLLESKIGSFSPSIEIVTLKRCNSEQCNNDFYLKSDDLLVQSRTCPTRSISLSLLPFLLTIIFYSKSNF